nr:2-hydroxyacyl-CoA dehydratase [Desulfobulbaceae bacterium]
MESNRFARMQKTTGLHLAMETQECMRRITEFPDNPLAMDYFYELFKNTYSENHVPETGLPLIGTMCVQVPEELIIAAGARPIRLCSGAYAYDQVGADFMPTKSCPLIKATAGMLHVNQSIWGDALKTVVIPTTCDQKKKSAELLASLGYRVYPLEMPSSKESDASRFYWQESVKQFTLDLQQITGTKITTKKIKEAIAKTSHAASLFRRLYELRKAAPALILGKDIFLVTNAYFFDDLERWQKATSTLISELEVRQKNGFRAATKQAPRILFTGSPPIFPNLKVPLLVEQAGAIIVADEVCSSNRILYDTVSYDEDNLNDIIPALADRYLKPCTCPCLTNNTDRLRKLSDMSDSYDVDGVVYQSFSGCIPYEMEQRQVNEAMTKDAVPVLYLETDYSPEDVGQLSTRIEAFIESIKARKRKKR